jgi:hypothetical protein
MLYAFRRGSIDIPGLLEEARSAVSNRPDDDRALQYLRHLCKSIAFSRRIRIETEVHNMVVEIALELGDVEVLKPCLKILGDQLSSSAGSHFGKAILSLGFPNLKPM